MDLHVAVFEDTDRTGLNAGESRWIARGLSYDFIGEGMTGEAALANLLLAVKAEYEFAESDGRRPFEGLPETPEKFRTWVRAQLHKPLEVPRRLKDFLPEAWMIHAMGREAALHFA